MEGAACFELHLAQPSPAVVAAVVVVVVGGPSRHGRIGDRGTQSEHRSRPRAGLGAGRHVARTRASTRPGPRVGGLRILIAAWARRGADDAAAATPTRPTCGSRRARRRRWPRRRRRCPRRPRRRPSPRRRRRRRRRRRARARRAAGVQRDAGASRGAGAPGVSGVSPYCAGRARAGGVRRDDGALRHDARSDTFSLSFCWVMTSWLKVRRFSVIVVWRQHGAARYRIDARSCCGAVNTNWLLLVCTRSWRR